MKEVSYSWLVEVAVNKFFSCSCAARGGFTGRPEEERSSEGGGEEERRREG